MKSNEMLNLYLQKNVKQKENLSFCTFKRLFAVLVRCIILEKLMKRF